MKALFVGDCQDLCEAIDLMLKVRWPELSLIHARQSAESLVPIHREEPDIVMLHFFEPGPESVRSEEGGADPSDSGGAPTLSCFDLIARIRSFSNVPIIVISQSDDVIDRVRALEVGADDWISSSFIPMEFIAKVNAIIRRCSPGKQGIASFLNGRLAINYSAREVFVSGRPVRLTPIQYKILCHLVQNRGRVCSSSELLLHVWGPHYGDDREVLKRSVHRLRSRIEEDPSNPQIICNHRGVGYVISASDT